LSLLLLSLLSLPCTAAAGPASQPASTRPTWELVRGENYAIAVPEGWRKMDGLMPHQLVFRQGDGIGVPAVDETGSPLQIGMMVEKFAKTDDTLEDGAKKLVRSAKNNARLRLVGQEFLEPLKLSDGTAALLLWTEFIKDGDRHSLQLKMLAKDKDSGAWIVSAHIVGGKDSKLPQRDSALAVWLAAHVKSFCFDTTRFDAAALDRACMKPAR
jgi:hypothetical protein